MYRHEILVTRAQSVTAFSNGSVSLAQPANFTHAGSWARRACLTITVYEVEGSPTDWSLTGKLQTCLLHDGNQFRYQARRWFDLPDGDLGTIAGEGGATLPAISRTTVSNFGPDVRVLLAPSFTGGTSPKMRLGIERELWSD